MASYTGCPHAGTCRCKIDCVHNPKHCGFHGRNCHVNCPPYRREG